MSDKKTALITGANKGIGLEIARQLGKHGYAVWLGSRDDKRGEQAAEALRKEGLDARAIVLDVTSDASVAQAVAKFGDGKLDALINNAGIVSPGKDGVLEAKVDDMRVVYETNTFGPVRVTQAFLPALRKAQGACVVMVSSSLGSLSAAVDMTSETYNVKLLAYNSSKSALNMVTVLFGKELLADGIKVNACNPGYTATDLNGHHGTRAVKDGAAIAVELAMLGPSGPTAGYFHDGYASKPWRHAW
jgi:NAD(P)-dependent dehydrogenase (short-subunit alcohol dehydrogenase family)